MIAGRRSFLNGAAGLAAIALLPGRARAASEALIEMKGTPRGEHVWFAPTGLAVAKGATIRFVNRDPGNSHTATTYHPAILGRPLRIPQAAEPWDSGLLLPGQDFAVTLTVAGVYDLYCQPHEAAGMVARLIVGTPDNDPDWQDAAVGPGDLPPAALAAFPAVADILSQGAVMPKI